MLQNLIRPLIAETREPQIVERQLAVFLFGIAGQLESLASLFEKVVVFGHHAPIHP
ncbi:MAG: hypothetical protein ACTSYE_00645 [Alphaproteobacteria bacterium]